MKSARPFVSKLTLLIIPFFLSCQQEKTVEQSAQIIRDKAAINYRDTGEGGATLLFVHGAYIDQTYWDKQVEYFSQDYRVVTFDLPGHGKSGKGRPHWTIQGYAGDVYTLIKRLNLKNVILIGHSMGGDINLVAATYRPKNIIGFIGIDNFKEAATPIPERYRKAVEGFVKKLKTDFSETNERFVRSSLVSEETPAAITSRVIKDFRNAYQPMANELMPQIFTMYETERRLMPELKIKMHLINVDNTLTNEGPLKKYAGAGYDLKLIKGTSHYPMLENPNRLNIMLRQAIEEISRENDVAKKPL